MAKTSPKFGSINHHLKTICNKNWKHCTPWKAQLLTRCIQTVNNGIWTRAQSPNLELLCLGIMKTLFQLVLALLWHCIQNRENIASKRFLYNKSWLWRDGVHAVEITGATLCQKVSAEIACHWRVIHLRLERAWPKDWDRVKASMDPWTARLWHWPLYCLVKLALLLLG